MTTDREKMTAKHMARLSKLPANSGHAKVLRARLGLDAPEAPEAPVAVVAVVAVATPEPVVEEEAPKAKKKRKK